MDCEAEKTVLTPDLVSCRQKFIVSEKEVFRFVEEVFIKLGATPEVAKCVAESIADADNKGHYSHGMNRLGLYITDVDQGVLDLKSTPIILAESAATAWVDGNNALGVVVGNFCMQLAIKKAKESGIGWVVAKGSNHIGVVNFFPEQALKEGLLGFTCCNTSPVVAPWGAKEPALGTNPISFAAPGVNDDSFVMDISTSGVSRGKIELYVKHNQPLPVGWAIGSDGKYVTDAKDAYEKGALTPLGGENNGHKGYGLGLMAEAMSGILAGSKFGPFIRKWGKKIERGDLGQCYACINPEFFAPGYNERMSCLMDYLRNMDPVDPENPVQVPGDWERNNKKKHQDKGGVSYSRVQLQWTNDLAKKLGVAPLKFK
ncbi:hypothetical protein L9F63_019918 [Diploptera punctata]|uniref:Malate dehydrogenase n=1 Tax=Diploptera punctata TaxID=6984 RepID=A0AAD8EDW3_DIPPU|nr:hypothetical protein L9F63_019918 [Diploptera punctata]